jgi:MFS family permease
MAPFPKLPACLLLPGEILMANVDQRADTILSQQSPGEGERGIGRDAWLALAAALLGWMFDGAEQGVFSMVGRQAVIDLLNTQNEQVIGLWFGVVTAVFLVGAATGGVVFGWLGDRVGRVRAMTLSVLTYAVFTGLCGVATSPLQIGIFRFIAALGMGGEWSLGVALVMEVWPNRSRALMAGLIGAAANVGYLMVGFVGLGLAAVLADMHGWLTGIGLSDAWASSLVANKGWRLMMILGTAPAFLTFFIRIFVPESERWKKEEGRGSTSHWQTRDLLGVLLGATGPTLIIYLWAWEGPAWLEHTMGLRIFGSVLGLAIALVGYTYPLIRYLQRHQKSTNAPASATDPSHTWQFTVRRMLLAACLGGVALLGTWGSAQWAPSYADKLTGGAAGAKENTQIWLAVGAIVGTICAAMVGNWLDRRKTYFLLCVTALVSTYYLYLFNIEYGPMFLFSAFLVGVFTASFYGWLPLYLPELFRTGVRATAQGFGFNFGRILAAIGVLQTGNLMGYFTKDFSLGGLTVPGGYPAACSTMSLIYFVGMIIIWFAPETRGKPLPE